MLVGISWKKSGKRPSSEGLLYFLIVLSGKKRAHMESLVSRKPDSCDKALETSRMTGYGFSLKWREKLTRIASFEFVLFWFLPLIKSYSFWETLAWTGFGFRLVMPVQSDRDEIPSCSWRPEISGSATEKHPVRDCSLWILWPTNHKKRCQFNQCPIHCQWYAEENSLFSAIHIRTAPPVPKTNCLKTSGFRKKRYFKKRKRGIARSSSRRYFKIARQP